MNKKILSTAFSALMSLTLAASAAPGDCSKNVDGRWTGTITTVSGTCPSQYFVNQTVSAEFNSYEYVDSSNVSACNINYPGKPVSNFSFGNNSQSISGVIYPYSGAMVYLSIGRSDGQDNATGAFEDQHIRIPNMTPADASDCKIGFDLNK